MVAYGQLVWALLLSWCDFWERKSVNLTDLAYVSVGFIRWVPSSSITQISFWLDNIELCTFLFICSWCAFHATPKTPTKSVEHEVTICLYLHSINESAIITLLNRWLRWKGQYLFSFCLMVSIVIIKWLCCHHSMYMQGWRWAAIDDELEQFRSLSLVSWEPYLICFVLLLFLSAFLYAFLSSHVGKMVWTGVLANNRKTVWSSWCPDYVKGGDTVSQIVEVLIYVFLVIPL